MIATKDVRSRQLGRKSLINMEAQKGHGSFLQFLLVRGMHTKLNLHLRNMQTHIHRHVHRQAADNVAAKECAYI